MEVRHWRDYSRKKFFVQVTPLTENFAAKRFGKFGASKIFQEMSPKSRQIFKNPKAEDQQRDVI